MKKIIWIAIVVLVIGVVYYYLSSDTQVTEPEVANDFVTAEGVVSEINLEEVTFDGPALVTVEATDGEMHVIAVPSMGINLCEARDQIADVFALEVGEQVSVMGELDEEGRIVPCTDATHYLKVE